MTDGPKAPSGLPAGSHRENDIALLERKLQVIRDVATALGSTLDLDLLLQTIMAKTIEALDADRATLYVLDEEREEIWSKVTQGGKIQEIRLRIPEGIAGWVAKTGETVNIPDAYADERFNPDVDRRSGYRTRSMLTLPMLNTHGRIVGVVQVLNRRDGLPFGPEDEELLRALSSQAAVSIENGKLYQSLVQQNDELRLTRAKLDQRMYELDVLYQIEQERLRANSLDELLDGLAGKAMELVSARAASVLLVAEDRAELHFGAASGPKGHLVRKLRLPRGAGIVGWVVEHDQPLVVTDARRDTRHSADIARQVGYHPQTVLCVPIRGDDCVLGALELLDKVAGPAMHSASMAGQAVEGASNPDAALHRASASDPKTPLGGLPSDQPVTYGGGLPLGEALPFDDNDVKLASLIAGHIARAIQLLRAQEARIQEGRLAAIGQMLSGVLHDLKTPLTIASGYTQLLPSVTSQKQRESYCREILRQFELMDAMTREVLAFARGDLQLLVRKVYLHQYLADLREHLTRELEGKGIVLEMQPEFQGVAWFDEIKIRRVVHNLASNAARAMPEGGRFTFRCFAEGTSLVLRFTDTGSGIPEELEGRLFEPFTTSGRNGGTGLGLAIVDRIVTEHGGSIGYETSRSKGTTFTVTLPLSRGEDAPAEDDPLQGM